MISTGIGGGAPPAGPPPCPAGAPELPPQAALAASNITSE
jgi:hypothetical protein